MTTDLAVELSGITKSFGSHRAVDEVSLSVPTGCIYGFIGPNGSGKTTTLRMILRIIEPDSGSISVFGRKRGSTANEDIAYLPEERGIYRKLPVLRQLVYFGKLKGMRAKEAKEAAEWWLERMDLADWAQRKTEDLSKGMTQKIQFIATVIARPKLVVLDEPFSGLDPVNLEFLRSAVLQLRDEGATVIFSTHDMGTAEQMCDRICMIYRGGKVLDGSLKTIRDQYGSDTIRLEYEEGSGPEDPSTIPGVLGVRRLGRVSELRFEGDTQPILEEAMKHGRVRRFEVVHPSLHDIFVRIAQPKEEDMVDA